jgi:MerR family transcriptional regulator, light-induced transcriptional regulator
MRDTRPPNNAGGGADGSFSVGSAAFLDGAWPTVPRSKSTGVLPASRLDVAEKLDDVIAGEILPRLKLLNRRRAERDRGRAQTPALNMASQVADFAELVVRHESSVAEAYLKSLIERGLDLETLLLHLLAPAARRLGEMWDSDKIDFVDVTIGMSRLQQLIHYLTPPLGSLHDDTRRKVLLLPAPGEQHSFGLIMMSEMFRQQGWQVHGGAAMEPQQIFSLISQQRFAVIGFSLSCDRLIETLCSSIEAARRMSKNKSVQLMVGGGVFSNNSTLQRAVGADLVASDAREALVLAENAVSRSVGR